MPKKILLICFYLLFFLTPLIFWPKNYELFEFNKMIFVYLLSVIIAGVWLIRMALEKRLILKATPLDIPLLLFLLSQILSTVFSIDPHTSLWGYYSRSNGGLLSILSYILLYYSLVANFEAKEVFRFLRGALLGGLLVALWAIPEHFGGSPSCLFLTGSLNDSCWVQDVQSRVFATLGQPNWLAAYLEMLIFPAFYFILTAKNRTRTVLYSVMAILFYAAFTFTYSRGATLGLGLGMAVFLLFYLWLQKRPATQIVQEIVSLRSKMTLVCAIVLAFLLVNLFFGSALTRFQLFEPHTSTPAAQTSGSSVSQLDSEGGTESGQIRLIVWKGALEISKHYPLLGSGVETFAYSYYQYRPLAHNSVSEWDFLYNKAHNEYLNYLATTGILGLGTYLFLIGTFIAWCIRYLVLGSKQKTPESRLLVLAILCAYIAYLIQNFFQFSVVPIALFFFLFPGLVFTSMEKPEFWPLAKLPIRLTAFRKAFGDTFYRFALIKTLFIVFICLLTLFFSFRIYRIWSADLAFAAGSQYLDGGDSGRAYNSLIDAISANPHEPLYRSELGFAAASAAVALAGTDATTSAQLKDLAAAETEKVLHDDPKNVSFWRTAIRSYFEISTFDPSFKDKTLQVINTAINLAPTDPKLPYNQALILEEYGQSEAALAAFQQALKLKPDYHDALVSLSDYYVSVKQNDKAKDTLNTVLKYFPSDPEATAKLQDLDKAK